MSHDRTTDDTLRIVLIIVAALVLAPVLMMVVAFPMMNYWGGGMMGYGMYGGGSGLWGLGMGLVWLIVLVGVGYLVYRWFAGGRLAADPALEELRLAYARGEISDEEFEERRDRLGGE